MNEKINALKDIIIILFILILFTSGSETSELPHDGIQTTTF